MKILKGKKQNYLPIRNDQPSLVKTNRVEHIEFANHENKDFQHIHPLHHFIDQH
jgi:hypothetical protein